MHQINEQSSIKEFAVENFAHLLAKMPAFKECSDPMKQIVRPTLSLKIMVDGNEEMQRVLCMYNEDNEESYICPNAVRWLRLDHKDITMPNEFFPFMRAKLTVKVNDTVEYLNPIIVSNMGELVNSIAFVSAGDIDERMMAPDWHSHYCEIVLGRRFKQDFSGPCIDSNVEGLYLRYTRQGFVMEGEAKKQERVEDEDWD